MNSSTVVSQIIEIPIKNDKVSLDNPNVKKMVFVMNALEEGWSIRKKGDSYIFRKKHNGKKEIFKKEYLDKFIESGFDFARLLDK
jgi:hypothetical protein